MSNINYISIDENYPLAGKNNSSEGFRDNFKYIKDSLEAAKTEIESLETNVAKTTTSNNFNGNDISNANLIAVTEQVFNGGTIVEDRNLVFEQGSYQTFTVSNNLTFTLTDFPILSKYGVIRLSLRGNGSTVLFAANGSAIFYDRSFPTELVVSSSTIPLIIEIWFQHNVGFFLKYLGEFDTDRVGVQGVVRYNAELDRFEGYNNSTWELLGGVRDLDGNTYILPESSQGANDNTLYFVTDGITRLEISTTRFALDLSVQAFINNSTVSTSPTTGAAVIAGGVGIGGDLNVSSATVVGTTLTVNSSAVSSSTSTGAAIIAGGVGVGGNLNVGGDLNVGGTVVIDGELRVLGTATTINSSTLTVDDINIELGSTETPSDLSADGGGITLLGDSNKTISWLQSTGRWTFNQSVEAVGIQNTPIGSTVRSSGSFTTLTSNGATTFTSDVVSTDPTTGTLVVTGGVGVSQNLNVGGNVAFNGNTTIGDQNDDSVIFNAQVASDVIPDALSPRNLGSNDKFWNTLYTASAVINDYTLPLSDGTLNQVVKTDGQGNLSFGESDAFGGNRVYVSAAKGNDANDGVTLPVATLKRGVQIATEMAYLPRTPVVSKEDQGLLLLANKDFIADEVIEFINFTFPELSYNEARCRRDAVEIVESVVYDLRFGGNSRSTNAGKFYYNANGVTYVSGQLSETISGINYAKEIVENIIVNDPVSIVRGSLAQIFNPEITTDPNNLIAVQTSFDIVTTILNLGPGSAPSIVYGNFIPQNVTVMVATGNYIEQNPIIVGDDISVVGDNLRRSIIRPANPNLDMLRVRNSSYITGITFRDHVDSTGTPDYTFRYAVSFDNVNDTTTSRTGYVNLPARKPKIFTSPYIQNVSVISFLGAGGAEIDGNLVDSPNTPPTDIEAENPVDLVNGIPEQGKSMVANAFTLLSFGGNAWRVINDAYAQIVSCFVIFTENGCLTQSGGYLSITNSASNFGLFALRSTGYSPNSFDVDRGIIYGNGVFEAFQTLRINNLKRAPLEHYVIRIRSTVGDDITDNFNSDLSFGKTVSLSPSVSNVGSNTITFASAHNFVAGDYVEYDSNGNLEIVGLLNEVKYYVGIVSSTQIALYHDEGQTKPVRNLDASLCSGIHLFKTGYEEFFINEVLSTHNVYQDIVLPLGPTYTINIGDTISGLNGSNIISASIAQWEPTSRTLTVSLELVQEGVNQVRNLFAVGSTIDAGEVAGGGDITVTGTTNRTDLISSEFTVISTEDRPMINIGTSTLNQIYLHRPSICNSSAHTWEYSGSGTDYNALPQNGGRTDEAFEQVSTLPGRVYSSGTNELGDFKVGNFVRAFNRTGNIDFRNKVTIGELDSLALSLSSGIVVNQISSDIELGDNEIDGAKNTRLITQLAIRSFLDNRLGNFIDKSLSTNAIPSAVVQLNSQGQINSDLIPPQGNFTSYIVNVFDGRLALHLDIPVNDLRSGDIVIETYDQVTLTLNSAVSVVKGETISQANTGASGIVKQSTSTNTSVTLVAPFNGTFTTNVSDTLSGSTSGSLSTYPTVIAGPTEVKDNYFMSSSRISQFLILDKTESYDFTDIISNSTQLKGAVSGAVATVDSHEVGVLTAIDVVNDLPGGSGYFTPGTYTDVALTNVSGAGSGAIADVVVASGQITSVDIKRGGLGYTESDILSVSDGAVGGRSGGASIEINVTDVENRLNVTLNRDAGLEFNATPINLDYIIDDNVTSVSIVNQSATTTLSFDGTSTGVGGGVDVDLDTIDTVSAHGYSNGDPVEYDSNSNIVIGGLANLSTYFVKVINSTTIELYTDYSLQTSNKIDIISTSSGNHILRTRTVNTDENRFFLTAHGLVTGDAIRYSSATPPSGINNNDYLFVGSVTVNSFTLHNARGSALTSVNGLLVSPVNLIDAGTGSASIIKQNVVVIGDANTSGQYDNSWSSLSNTTIDANNIVSGVINPSRLGDGSANNLTFLRGDSLYAFAIQGIKNSEATDPITLTGLSYNDGSDDVYYGVVDIKIENAGYDNPIAPSAGTERKGIAAFDFDHFEIDAAGLVTTKSAGNGGVIDADTLDGQQGTFYINPINLNRTVPIERGGTNVASYTKGDILFAGSDIGNGTFSQSMSKLAIGAGNTVLSVDNVSNLPVWTDALTLTGLTVDNVRVGITTTNTIDTGTGGLTLDSASGTVTIDDNLNLTGNLLLDGVGSYISFEGATANTFETILNVVDPTADRTILLPDASGTVALTTNLYTGWSLYTDNTDRGSIADNGIVNFVAGSNVTLNYSATNNTITINSTDTNTNTDTTYNLSVVQNAGSDNNPSIRLAGADSSINDVQIVGGTNVTVTRNSASQFTISSIDTDTDTNTNDYVDSVSFSDVNGVLTLGRTGSLADLTANLDGRYLTGESDTLSSVTARGSTTTSVISVGGATISDTGTLLSRTLSTGLSTTTGIITGQWSLSSGSRLEATYADLAEIYSTDTEYEPGTVVMFGGEAELTAAFPQGTLKVAGVISTNPAYLMNNSAVGQPIALKGRIPCKVIGKVSKGDLLIASNIPGVAIASEVWIGGAVIGKAIESSSNEGIKLIEIAAGVL